MGNNLKFNSSVCTTREQSQRLLDLGLKPETADMYYTEKPRLLFIRDNGIPLEEEDFPAWSLHRLMELYKDVGDTSMWSLEDVNYNRLIQCISLAIKHGAFNKEYLK